MGLPFKLNKNMFNLNSFFKDILLKPQIVFTTLPEFPKFKPLELSDKQDIEKITNKYPPYSDFNFVSMWSWDIKDEMRVSQFYGNLVVRFTDYLTGVPFYSFLGDNKVNETAEALLKLSKNEGLKPELRLVPESSINRLHNQQFNILEDRDHFDYILDNDKIQRHQGKKLRYHSNLCNRLINESGAKLTVRILDLNEEKQKQEILMLTSTWIRNKSFQNNNNVSSLEMDAIKRFFLINAVENLSIGVFYNDKLIGCSINDPLEGDYFLCHFMKADSVFNGIYSFLFIETARMILDIGKKYTNIEQDLGILSLRQSKNSFEPAFFLKKYIVTVVV